MVKIKLDLSDPNLLKADEIMEQLEVAVGKEFKYGSAVEDTAEIGIEDAGD